MNTERTTMAGKIAKSACEFQQHCTGRAPESVTAALGDDTLVITLYGALSPAEKVLAQSTLGAAQVQEFHRQLFATSSADLVQEIKRIIGTDVHESAAEVETVGTVIHAFTTGTVVQVFHFAKALPLDADGISAVSPMAVGRFPVLGTSVNNSPPAVSSALHV